MGKKCDLYVCDQIRSERLRFLKIFDKNFLYDPEKTYVGYLGIEVDRVKMISVVSDLRAHEITCFSVPVNYRVHENIALDHAYLLANEFAKKVGASAIAAVEYHSRCPPVYWVFGLRYEQAASEKVGGVVMIDRIDGHVWSDVENEEYMYDYNNLF